MWSGLLQELLRASLNVYEGGLLPIPSNALEFADVLEVSSAVHQCVNQTLSRTCHIADPFRFPGALIDAFAGFLTNARTVHFRVYKLARLLFSVTGRACESNARDQDGFVLQEFQSLSEGIVVRLWNLFAQIKQNMEYSFDQNLRNIMKMNVKAPILRIHMMSRLKEDHTLAVYFMGPNVSLLRLYHLSTTSVLKKHEREQNTSLSSAGYQDRILDISRGLKLSEQPATLKKSFKTYTEKYKNSCKVF